MVHAQHADAVSIDRDALSPLKDAFPKSAVLEPVKTDRLSPTKASFSFGTGPAEDVTPTQTGSGDSPTAGPFNFNTTVMAKGPVVKSVSADGPVKIEKHTQILIFLIEHWTTSWPQIQAQQYLASDLPRAPSTRAPGSAQFTPDPNVERMPV
jgi:hypothetical protein